MAGQRSRAKAGKVDDFVVFDASILDDQDDAEATVREWATRAGDIADSRRMRRPITVRFIDSDGQPFLSSVLTEDGGSTEVQAEKLLRGAALPTPWFLVLEDAQGQTVKVRLEIGPHSIQ